MIASEVKRDMDELLSKVQEVKCGVNVNKNIKFLAKRLSVPEVFSLDGMSDVLTKEEKEYVDMVSREVRGIVDPVLRKVSKKALKHFKSWYRRISPESDLHVYQYFIACWTLDTIIMRKDVSIAYTLLVSRGGGKTHTMSALAVFLLIYWKKYILHSKAFDFSTLISAPFEKQILSFSIYTRQFLSLSVAENIVGANEKDGASSEEKLFIHKDNSGELSLRSIVKGRSSSVHSRIYYCVATSSMESKHADLLLMDEMKFIKPKVFDESVMPCLGGRLGQAVLISSASEEWCLFQELIEVNEKMEKEDGIKRHIELHYSKMWQHNTDYMFTVERARKRGGNAFLTQYENKFLSTRKSSFADMEELDKLGVFNYESAQDKRIGDYVLVGGWDIAVTGDSSVLVIKAMENKIGVKRKSWIVNMFIINKSKDKTIDSVAKQSKRVAKICMEYDLDYLVIDGTGVGKSASSYVIEECEARGSYRYSDFNIVEIDLKSTKRDNMLSNYYTRLNSGQENFRNIDSSWKNENAMRDRYAIMQSEEHFDIQSMWVRFIYEHMKFIKKEVVNEDTGITKTVFMQEPYSWLHDDFVFASALCSQSVFLEPTLMKWERAVGGKPNARRSTGNNPRVKRRSRRR